MDLFIIDQRKKRKVRITLNMALFCIYSCISRNNITVNIQREDYADRFCFIYV